MEMKWEGVALDCGPFSLNKIGSKGNFQPEIIASRKTTP